MTNLSIIESVFLILLCLVNFIVPVTLLVLGYLIYNKLGRIEEMIKNKE